MTVDISIFKAPETDEEAGKILAGHMPQGRAWDKKNDPESSMNGLVKGLAADFMQVQQKIYEMAEEFNINLTTDLLPDWETSVGIPDDCVFTFNTLAERRQRVIERLRNVPVVTKQEMTDYLQAFFDNNTITISNIEASETFEFTFELSFTNGINDKFVLNINITQDVVPTYYSETSTWVNASYFQNDFTGNPSGSFSISNVDHVDSSLSYSSTDPGTIVNGTGFEGDLITFPSTAYQADFTLSGYAGDLDCIIEYRQIANDTEFIFNMSQNAVGSETIWGTKAYSDSLRFITLAGASSTLIISDTPATWQNALIKCEASIRTLNATTDRIKVAFYLDSIFAYSQTYDRTKISSADRFGFLYAYGMTTNSIIIENLLIF